MISYKLSGLKSLTLLLFSLPFISFAQEISPTLSNYPGGYNISCHGANNGFINIVVVGEAPPFLYNWSNGATTKNITQLVAGNYTLIVTDANSNTVSMDFDLSQPNLVGVILHPRVFEGGHNIPEPGGNDGLIETEISGGVSPYSYSWSNGSIEQNLEGVQAGTYTLTVTDMNGCSASASATLTEASVVHVTNISSPFQNGYNISCHGIKDGSIRLDVAGGTPPYDFTWMDGYKEKDRTELEPGNYTVIIKDLNDIAEAAQILLTGPTELQAQLTPTIYANTKNISCYGCANGHITTTVTGGVSPYTYLWNDGATGANRNGLVQGQYNVQITDANGCVIEAGLNIIGPEREDWTMMGNAGTDPVTNFFGTIDNKDMVFKTNNVERFRIRSNGKVEALGGLKLFANSADLYQSVYADETGLLRTGPSGSGQCDAPATAWFEDVCSNRTSIFNFPLSKLVGIGTKTPDAELDVFGQIRSSVLSGTAGFNVVHTGADGKLSALQPPSNNASQYILDGSGSWSQLPSGASLWNKNANYIVTDPIMERVGIKTQTPNDDLDIGGLFTFHGGNTNKWIGFNNYYDYVPADPLLSRNRRIIEDEASRLQFGDDGSIRFRTADLDIINSEINFIDALHIEVSGKIGVNRAPDPLIQFSVNGDAQFLGSIPSSSFQIVSNKNPVKRGIRLDQDPSGNFDFYIHKWQNDESFNFLVNNESAGTVDNLLSINGNGTVSIGAVNYVTSGYLLGVHGKIIAEEVVVRTQPWPDYVFHENYKLKSLEELGEFIALNRHLPEIPTANEIEDSGLSVGKILTLQMQKIEELTLYVLELQRQIDSLNTNK